MTLSIEVENKFERGRREILVYNSSEEEYRIISWKDDERRMPKGEFTFNNGAGRDDDYLLVTVAPGPGDLKRCKVDLPSNIPFIFIPGGVQGIEVIPSGNKTSLKIPEGPPTWQLKIPRPSETMAIFLGDSPEGGNNVTVGDDGPGG